MLDRSWKKYLVFTLIILNNTIAYADEEFQYSKFFKAKELVKTALEDVTLRAARFKKTKELQTAIVSNLTGLLLGLKNKYNVDFAVISNENNNSEKLLEKDILFTTVKLKYKDVKGEIVWELTSVISPNEINFYSVIDDGKEMTENDVYNYKSIYRQ